jgi:hypothetical protein
MQSNRRLKDNSIGLGISSSKIIAQNNGGDLIITPKRYRISNYATQIEITTPVEISDPLLGAISIDQNSPRSQLLNRSIIAFNPI